MKSLKSRFGSEFNELSKEQKLALATVAIEGSVTHARIKVISDIHPHDLLMELKDLVTRRFLQSAGATRAMVYTFPRPGLSESDDPVHTRLDGIAEQKNGSSVHLPDSSVHLLLSSVHLKTGSEHLQRLRSIAKPIEGKRKVPVKIMEDVILKLCKEDYLALKDIAEILNRTPETLRIHYLNRMVKGGLLELRYPDKPSHPDQGYRTHK
jgi:ATP-dependent DNA helicase RecG